MAPLVFIISPFRPSPQYSAEQAIEYATTCFHHSMRLREVPFVGHLYFTRFLDDSRPKERTRGMEMNYSIMQHCILCAVYTNLGISEGMLQDIRVAHDMGITLSERQIPKWSINLNPQDNPSSFPPVAIALLPGR